MDEKQNKGLNIGVRSFLISIGIIFLLMVATYILTLIIPGRGISFIKWLLSPILVLGAPGSGTIIAVLIFLLVIGGIFNSLTVGGLMNYMLSKLVNRFGDVKYKLMAVLVLFFMAMGSFVGSFEEIIPMTPIVVGLAVALGWDKVTGMAMSLLAAGCGFAAGIANPFTIGIAQGLAGLPMFSGIWFRALSFVFIYALLLWYIRRHAIAIENTDSRGAAHVEYTDDPRMNRGIKAFAIILGAGILIVLSSSVITALQDYTMIIVALMFLIAGIVAVLLSGMSMRELGRTFVKGMITIAPSILMILMASSIKYTMEESGILDTMLNSAADMARGMSKSSLILFIYLICLVMNFFIASGSAKVFLLIPIIAPLAQMFGLSMQLAISAFAFGDGFSNVFYPTNAGLLIALGLTEISYGEWFRYSWKFQALNLILTSGLLLFGLAIGY
ncbi:MAG: YfcC family protein [Mogibacterium sp.]|nr:YfcC family protein [Mogibacterium sp.]